MNITLNQATISRCQVIEALSGFRLGWEFAAEGNNLLNVKANLGFVLVDIAEAIGLTPEEQVQALGPDLLHKAASI